MNGLIADGKDNEPLGTLLVGGKPIGEGGSASLLRSQATDRMLDVQRVRCSSEQSAAESGIGTESQRRPFAALRVTRSALIILEDPSRRLG